jgi:hypothetical protein
MRGSLLNREPEVVRVLRDDSHDRIAQSQTAGPKLLKRITSPTIKNENISLSTVGFSRASQLACGKLRVDVLYQGTTLEAAEKLMFCIRARL